MAAGSTYTPIATTTLGSSASSYTFSSIPSTYTDLRLVVDGTIAAGPDDIRLRFNGDTASNYSITLLRGSGSAVLSARGSGTYMEALGYLSTTQGNTIFEIMNYANSTTYKTVLSRGNLAASFVNATVGLWRSTSAITSITALAGGSTFQTGTVLTLYGIAAA